MPKEKYQSKLMARRDHCGYTRNDIASALGVTLRTVRNWETGKTEPQLLPWQVAELCKMLKCSIEEFAGYFQEVIKAA